MAEIKVKSSVLIKEIQNFVETLQKDAKEILYENNKKVLNKKIQKFVKTLQEDDKVLEKDNTEVIVAELDKLIQQIEYEDEFYIRSSKERKLSDLKKLEEIFLLIRMDKVIAGSIFIKDGYKMVNRLCKSLYFTKEYNTVSYLFILLTINYFFFTICKTEEFSLEQAEHHNKFLGTLDKSIEKLKKARII